MKTQFLQRLKKLAVRHWGGTAWEYFRGTIAPMLPGQYDIQSDYGEATQKAAEEFLAFLTTHRGFDLTQRRQIHYAIERLESLSPVLTAIEEHHSKFPSSSESDLQVFTKALATVEAVTGCTVNEIEKQLDDMKGVTLD